MLFALKLSCRHWTAAVGLIEQEGEGVAHRSRGHLAARLCGEGQLSANAARQLFPRERIVDSQVDARWSSALGWRSLVARPLVAQV